MDNILIDAGADVIHGVLVSKLRTGIMGHREKGKRRMEEGEGHRAQGTGQKAGGRGRRAECRKVMQVMQVEQVVGRSAVW